MTINPNNYHTWRNQNQYTHYDDHADESESDEDVNQPNQSVDIEQQDVNSIPKVPPNSPETLPIPIPIKKLSVPNVWPDIYFGD